MDPLGLQDHERVVRWRGTLTRGTSQYASPVRTFLRGRAEADASTALTDELLRFVASLANPDSAKRAMSALASFYGFLSNDEGFPDPSRNLPARFREWVQRNELLTILSSVVNEQGRTRLLWVDVLAPHRPRPEIPLPEELAARLKSQLLARIHNAASPDAIATLLDEPLTA